MSRFKAKDHYFHKAKKENFVARSVYKLEEIDKKFKLLKAGQTVLDLGAAPGSWSQYSLSRVGSTGKVIAIDLNPIVFPNAATFSNLTLIQDDASNLMVHLKDGERGSGFDVVLSDMAPKTTGIKMTDQARSAELCLLALEMCEKHLKRGGSFVCKFFHSADYGDFIKQVETQFATVKAIKPEATRSMSKEIFIIGLSKKAAHTPVSSTL